MVLRISTKFAFTDVNIQSVSSQKLNCFGFLLYNRWINIIIYNYFPSSLGGFGRRSKSLLPQKGEKIILVANDSVFEIKCHPNLLCKGNRGTKIRGNGDEGIESICGIEEDFKEEELVLVMRSRCKSLVIDSEVAAENALGLTLWEDVEE